MPPLAIFQTYRTVISSLCNFYTLCTLQTC